jgi:predicted phage terminase large subunit-like protein
MENLMTNTAVSQDVKEVILRDEEVRIETAKKSHLIFFHTYFPHYVEYETAPFQKEILGLTEDESVKMTVIVAFRGSAKSTIVSLSYPLWAILSGKCKFALLLSQNQEQARQLLRNIKAELQTNSLLRNDFGPFEEKKGDLGVGAIIIPKFGAKIMAASSEQSIRGVRHREHRPDLIICDDIEDLGSVKNRESRDKTFQWLMGDVIPAGDRDTRMFVVGNLLHEDSTLMRLRSGIENNSLDGIYRESPLVSEDGNPLWPGKFPDERAIKEERRKYPDDRTWYREFLLKIIPDGDRVVRREWIKTYDNFPDRREYQFTATGIDLAISQKSTADFTAAVSARVYGAGKDAKIYILPNPINERMTFRQSVEKVLNLARRWQNAGHPVRNYVEDVGYQRSYIETLKGEGMFVIGVPVCGQDKRARLAVVSDLVESGRVLFPGEGAEILIDQLVNFGIEKHDDLADAFSILLRGMEDKIRRAFCCGVLITKA